MAHSVGAGDVCESSDLPVLRENALADVFFRLTDFYELQPSVARWRSESSIFPFSLI